MRGVSGRVALGDTAQFHTGCPDCPLGGATFFTNRCFCLARTCGPCRLHAGRPRRMHRRQRPRVRTGHHTTRCLPLPSVDAGSTRPGVRGRCPVNATDRAHARTHSFELLCTVSRGLQPGGAFCVCATGALDACRATTECRRAGGMRGSMVAPPTTALSRCRRTSPLGSPPRRAVFFLGRHWGAGNRQQGERVKSSWPKRRTHPRTRSAGPLSDLLPTPYSLFPIPFSSHTTPGCPGSRPGRRCLTGAGSSTSSSGRPR